MTDFNAVEFLYKIGLLFVPFLFALCFHEYAHGWMARRKGDNTAELMGRLTLNPLAHMDWLGTLVLPILAITTGFPFFGWAKPVPVNARNLARPKQDMFWIAFAGPLSNVLLAVVGCGVLAVVVAYMPRQGVGESLNEMLQYFIVINLFLAVFNMIPLHPLDGGKVLARFIPESWNRWLEDTQMYSMYILMAAFILGAFKYLALPVQMLAVQLIGFAELLSIYIR